MAALFTDEADIEVAGCASSLKEALNQIEAGYIALVSTNLTDNAALQIAQTAAEIRPSAKILVMGLAESEAKIIQYVEAGASGPN